jgi:ketosteroid isomerase-like protein
LYQVNQNKALIQKINEEFSKGNKEYVLDHLADDIRWNIVGMPVINGKSDFIKTMEMMESAVGGFSDIDLKNVIAEGDYVVVEGTGSSDVKEVRSYLSYETIALSGNPSFCDVYHIVNGKIKELTSYIVDIA